MLSSLTVEYLVEGIFLFVFACLGIAANILAMRVFAGKMFHTFYRYNYTILIVFPQYFAAQNYIHIVRFLLELQLT